MKFLRSLSLLLVVTLVCGNLSRFDFNRETRLSESTLLAPASSIPISHEPKKIFSRLTLFVVTPFLVITLISTLFMTTAFFFVVPYNAMGSEVGSFAADPPSKKVERGGESSQVSEELPRYSSRVTPILPEYEITTPSSGEVFLSDENQLSFLPHQEIAFFSKDPVLCEREGKEIRFHYEELKEKENEMNFLHEKKLISQQEWKKFHLEKEKAFLEINAIERSWKRGISFPFPGRILEVMPLRIQRTDIATINLALPLKIMKRIKKGTPFHLALEGKKVDYQLLEVGDEGVTVTVNANAVALDRPSLIELSFLPPNSLSLLPSGKLLARGEGVRYQQTHELRSPVSGNIEKGFYLNLGEPLNANSRLPITFDTTSIDAEIQRIEKELDYQEWQVANLKKLRAQKIGSEHELKKEEFLLTQLKKKRDEAKNFQAKLLKPGVAIPWDAVVLEDSFCYQGQSCVEGAPLLRIAKKGLFSAHFLLDEVYFNTVRVGDKLNVFLDGKGEGGEAQVKRIEKTITLLGDKKLKVTIEVKDSDEVLFPGCELEVVIANSEQVGVPAAEWVYQRIVRSGDLDEAFERITEVGNQGKNKLLYQIATTEETRPEIREWALLHLRLNKQIALLLDAFVLLQENGYSRLFSFLTRLIHELVQDDEIELYTSSALRSHTNAIEAYLGFLSNQARFYPFIAKQLQSASDLEGGIQRSGRAFLAPRQQKHFFLASKSLKEILTFFELYDEEALRNERDLTVLLSTEPVNNAASLLSKHAPSFLKILNFSPEKFSRSLEKKNLPSDDISNIAFFLKATATLKERFEHQGSLSLTSDLCVAWGSIEPLISSGAIQKMSREKLIELYFNLDDHGKKALILYMESAGLLADVETALNAEDRIFYSDILARDLFLEKRSLIVNALLKTYHSELALSSFVSDEESLKSHGIQPSEFASVKKMGEAYLNKLILIALCQENISYFYGKSQASAGSSSWGYAQKYARLIELQNKIKAFDFFQDGEDRFDGLLGEAAQFDITPNDLTKRITYHQDFLNGKAGEYWRNPKVLTKKTFLFFAAIFAAFYFLIVKPIQSLKKIKKTSKPNNGFVGALHKSSGSLFLTKKILSLWAQSEKEKWQQLHQNTKKNLLEFYLIAILKLSANIAFIMLVTLIEMQGGVGQIVIAWLGLIVIDQITNVAQEIRREQLGRNYHDLFPFLLENEINYFKQIRGVDRKNVTHLFGPNSLRLSRAYAMGKLAVICSLEHFISFISIVCGFALISPWLSIVYFIFSLLVIRQFIKTATREFSLGALGEEKEKRLSEGIRNNAFLIQLGFIPNGHDVNSERIKEGADALIREKIKYSIKLRSFSILFPGVGALCSLPLSASLFSKEMHSFFFLPDFVKSLSEGRFAEREIAHFTETAVRFTNKYNKPKLLPVFKKIDCLEISDLTLRVGSDPKEKSQDTRTVVLSSVNLKILPGTVNFLGGKPGSGKTALLHAIAGLDPSQIVKGKITLNGQDRSERQNPFHYFSLEGLEGIYDKKILLELLDDPKKRERFLWYIKEYIGGEIDQIPYSSLSSGQKSLVTLAFILSFTHAPILLLDQPFSWIDENSKEKWIELLKKEAAQTGRIVIIAAPATPVELISDQYDNIYFIKEKKIILKQNSSNERLIQLPLLAEILTSV